MYSVFMKPIRRYLESQVKRDILKKMVFVGGPRQVGKTTLARGLPGGDKGYLNWDVPADRERILRRELPASGLLVFDEIHKYRQWRNYLKGLFDAKAANLKIVVTGSARLDLYRFGGDSLQGRYHYLRLHPLSVAELGIKTRGDFLSLLRLGGFPEPFFSGSEKESRRWSLEYRTRLIQDDILSLERVQDIGSLELLILRLPELVGSPLSVNSLREDLQLNHKTVSNWLDIFERIYAIFRLPPFGAPRIRAVKKERKHYHYDWTLVKEPGPRFENLVASHLLKWTHFLLDSEGRNVELRYFRDVDGREVDFVVVEDGRPVSFIECKWSDAPVSKGLRYVKARFPEAEAFQIHAEGSKDYVTPEGIRVTGCLNFLRGLK